MSVETVENQATMGTGVDEELLQQATQVVEMGTDLPPLDADPESVTSRGVYSALLAGVQRSMM